MSAAVAAIVPVREPAPFLDEALESLPVEALVVRDPEGRGPAWARNQALRKLRPEIGWVAFCDADDVWCEGKLEAQLAVAEDADVLVGRAVIVDEEGRVTGETWGAPDVERLYESNPILLSSVMVRRELLDELGGFAEDLPQAEDWDLWLRLRARGARFADVPAARVRYRRHPGGLTRDVAALAKAQLEVHRRHAASVPGDVAARVMAADGVALADGLYRRREWRAGRAALREAARLGPVPRAARVRAAVAAVPVARAALGRRDPYSPS